MISIMWRKSANGVSTSTVAGEKGSLPHIYVRDPNGYQVSQALSEDDCVDLATSLLTAARLLRQNVTAKKPRTRRRPHWQKLADDAAEELRKVAGAGLDPCYNNNFKDEYLPDWYSDLPWDETMLLSMQHILDNHGDTLDLVQKKFRFSMRKELKKALKENQEEVGEGK